MDVDVANIRDAGFDKYLKRSFYTGDQQGRYIVDSTQIKGGELPVETVINIGPYIRIDGRIGAIIVSDGTDDRIRIGYLNDGF